MKRVGFAAAVIVAGLVPVQSVLAAMAIRYDVPLAFGRLVSANVAGSVTVTPTGQRNTAAVVPLGNVGFSAASFTVQRSGTGNPHYTIVLPQAVTLTAAGGATMRVDGFTSAPAARGKVDPKSEMDTLVVGATLRVGARQQPGAYSGTFMVTVAHE